MFLFYVAPRAGIPFNEVSLIPVFHKKSQTMLIKGKEIYKQNKSTEGCSKRKSPETRQVQERLVSTLEHMEVPKGRLEWYII